MKRILSVIALFLGVVALFAVSAQATLYTDTDFNNMVYVNGSYVPGFAGGTGYAALSYVNTQMSTDDDAVVGVTGPLGTLNSLNMGFTYSNPIGTGNAPFAAFGISDNSTWAADNHRLNVISENGNLLIGTSLVHVWDWTLNGGNGGDVTGLSAVTLNSILSTYGTWEVMRAYAYIGDTGGPSYGSVNINSITVNSVPLPPSALLLGSGLLGLVGLGWRRRRATAKS